MVPIYSGIESGTSNFPYVSLPTDQLTCLPEPLIPLKRFFMWHTDQAMFFGGIFQDRHQQLLMACCIDLISN
jgi:hypothetical protein